MSSNVHNIEEARPKEQQVYKCTAGAPTDSGECESQGHVLRKDGLIVCGVCLSTSVFEWFIPEQVSLALKGREPREKMSPLLHEVIFVCRNCSGHAMHLYEHGTIHCKRCKKQTAARFRNPAEE